MSTAPGIDAAVTRSDLLGNALDMARRAHRGQIRNASGGRPYIDHPIAVAERLSERGYSDEVLAAALLHDVVEDSELEVEDVRQAAGDRVAEIVEAMTDDDGVEPYVQRKREHREEVETAGPEALAVYAADKLTNLSMLRDAYAADGEEIAGELKVPLDEKVTVWNEDLEMLGRKSEGDPALADLADEFAGQLRSLARDRSAAPHRAG
jgi:(p)ppGpp synthase/HD superfamily hydrolase